MTDKKNPKLGWIERLAFNYFKKKSKDTSFAVDEFHIMNPQEQATIKRVTNITLVLSALFGVLGVVVLYVPIYCFPNFFFDHKIFVPILNTSFDLPIITTIYSTILVFIELYALIITQLWAVCTIAYACGYLNLSDPDYTKNIHALIAVGMEKKEKKLLAFGINPFAGISKLSLFFFMLITRLKATISNYAVKLILRRFFGRIVLRQVVDMAGIPIFAFWNAWAAFIVVKEAKVRIMASSLTKNLVDQLYNKLNNNEEFRNSIYDVLQFIAISKRDFHHNHFFLADSILKKFEIPVKSELEYNQNFLEKLKHFNSEAKNGFVKLIIFGMIADGSLSRREKKKIDQLYKNGIIPIDINEISIWNKSYMSGKGLDALMNL